MAARFSISRESAIELRDLAVKHRVKKPDPAADPAGAELRASVEFRRNAAAITRLEQGIGYDGDVERVATLYELAGKVAVARELRRAL